MNRTTVRVVLGITMISLLVFAVPVVADQVSITIKPGALQNASPGDAPQKILQRPGLTFQMADNNTAVLKKKKPTEKQSIAEQQKNTTEESTIQHARREMKLEELVVSAQKVEENVLDVPISMSVFDEFTLEDRNVDTLSEISKYTPGLEIVGYGTSDKYAPAMRGMYSDYSQRSSVAGLYVDSVPTTGGTGYDVALLDIERVEVLKGPQGTLYGKNTEAGVINVITRRPDNETRGKIRGILGSDNKRELVFTTSGPIVKDKFYIGVSGKHYEKDGFTKNYNTGEMVDDKEHNYGKIHLRYTPTDDLELSLISSLIKYDDGAQSGGLTKDNPREVGNDLDAYNKSSILQHALNINYTINDKLSLSSTTAYRDYNEKNGNDFDYTGDYSKRFHTWKDSTFKTISEELKLNGCGSFRIY